MDVENTLQTSAHDDSPNQLIQDLQSSQVHHDQEMSSHPLNKKKRQLPEPLNDLDSDEDNDGVEKIYQEMV